MSLRIRRAVAAVALVGACAGCASATAGSSQPLSDAARSQLQTDVLAVSRAISAHNIAGARAALGDLQHDLAALEGSGAVSADRAAQIETVIAQLSARLRASTTGPHTSAPRPARTTSAAPKPAPTAPVIPQPKPPGKHKGHDGGGGRGSDRGNG